MDPFQLIAAVWPSGEPHRDPKAEVDIHGLIERAQRGDSEAVTMLYNIFVQPIYRYLLYRTPSVADAEDLTAEVFLRMVAALPHYRITEVPFEAWLYRIAAARVADFYRHQRKARNSELHDEIVDHGPLPEERVLQEQMFETVRAALQQLSEEHQTILILRFVEHKSHKEVALILDKSMTAVKSAQHRALSQLARILGSDQKIRHYLRGDRD